MATKKPLAGIVVSSPVTLLVAVTLSTPISLVLVILFVS